MPVFCYTEEAVNQIKDKRYKEGLASVYKNEKIVAIGVGFKGKQIKMERI